MKNYHYWIIGFLVLAAIIATIFFPFNCGGESSELIALRQEKNTRDSLDLVAKNKSLLKAEQDKKDSLAQKEFRRDSLINYLVTSLDSCCPPKKQQTVKKREKSYIPPPPPQKEYKSPYTAPPSTADFSPPKREQDYDTKIGLTNVAGIKDGDFFTTISEDGYLIHGIAHRLWLSGNLRLNLEKGILFTKEGEYWIAKTTTKVSEAMLSGSYVITWSVYAGDSPGYPVWLPHELIKGDIMTARGYLHGAIDQEDVKKIGQIVPEIAAKRIIPNQVRKTNEGYAHNDELYYEGWSFRTLILYRQK